MNFNIFQVAYAVANIDEAAQAGGLRFGIRQFQINRDVPIETTRGLARCHFAMAFLGDTQIELIQPAGGADDVYRDVLRPGGAFTLHHLGCLVRDEAAWRARLAALEASGLGMPVRGAFGDLMHYVYADTRLELGHYLEYMYQTEAGAGLFANVPRYAGVQYDRT